jgi:hypothetical protein
MQDPPTDKILGTSKNLSLWICQGALLLHEYQRPERFRNRDVAFGLTKLLLLAQFCHYGA